MTLYVAPPYSGKTYLAKQGRWTDGDTLVEWPAGRFWEDPEFDIDAFYLDKALPPVLAKATKEDVAFYIPPRVIKMLSDDVLSNVTFIIPALERLRENANRDTRHHLQRLSWHKIETEYTNYVAAVTSLGPRARCERHTV
jgi:hypothetical protein